MKRLFRVVCAVFAAAALSMGVTAAAVNDVVDMSNSTHGYVTVNYSSSARLKVGIQYNGGKTVFYDCPSGKDASFSLDKGNGKYTVTLYRNVSGTSYQQVESKSMNVTVKDSYAPYLVSTSEVQFSKGDTVSAKAAELCKNAKTDEAKVIAIYNYMASRYTCLLYTSRAPGELQSELAEMDECMPHYYKITGNHGQGAETIMRAEAAFLQGRLTDAHIELESACARIQDNGQANMALCCDFLAWRLSLFAEMKYHCTLAERHAELLRQHNASWLNLWNAIAAYYYALLGKTDKIPEVFRAHRLSTVHTLAPGKPCLLYTS